MECGCGVNKVLEFKVEADIGADPIWCNKCGYNLDIEDFKISKNLEEKLMNWISQYGKWIDWTTDTLVPNAAEMEDIEVALVMNELGRHWVPLENLVEIDEVISESR